MKRTLAEAIAQTADARTRCDANGNSEWEQKHEARLVAYERNHLPSGSGFDNGCTIDRELTELDGIVIHTSFHHMNENGMYTEWTDHTVKIYPTFCGLQVKVSGRNVNDIKDYIAEIFSTDLAQEIEE